MPSRHLQAGSTLIWLAVWLVGMAAIAYWCVARHVPVLQQQIINSAQAAVTSANAGDIDLSVAGRTATLAGVVKSEAQKEQLINVVADAEGVRHVDDQLTLIGSTELNTNDTELKDNETSDTKTVSTDDDDLIQEIPAVTAANNEPIEQADDDQPDKLVIDEIVKEELVINETVEDELVINEADEKERVIENAVDTTPEPQLAEPIDNDIQVAELKIEPELPVNAAADSTLSADSVDARALALIEEAKRETANPLIDPETPQPNNNLEQQNTSTSVNDAQSSVAITELPLLKMQINDGTLTLTGQISDQDSLLQLIRSAMSTLNANYVVNSVQVNDYTAKADWLPALNRFLPEMNPISNAGIDIIESQITLSGEAANNSQHDKVIDSALTELSELSLVERISINRDTQSIIEPVDNNTVTTEIDTQADTQQLDSETQRQALKELFESLDTGKILFQSGSDVLTDESLRVLDSIASTFAQYPSVNIEIDGHTDASGVSAKNLDLSQLRANAVRDYLEIQGIATERMSTYGFGDGVPIADNSTAAGRRLNRRIEFNF